MLRLIHESRHHGLKNLVSTKVAQLRKKRKILGGRQIIWLSKEYVSVDPAAGRLHTYEDLLSIQNMGGSDKDPEADFRNLAVFAEKWDKIVGSMEQQINSSLLKIHYLREIRKSFAMKDDVRDHDNACLLYTSPSPRD